MDVEDVEYLNRVFGETTHEVAYCGLITHEEEPRLQVRMADTVNAGPREIEFITANCPEATREVLIHTHPGGALRLSDEDQRMLAARSEDFMCVQGGPIVSDPGTRAENLACYRQIDSGGLDPPLARLPVTVTRSD